MPSVESTVMMHPCSKSELQQLQSPVVCAACVPLQPVRAQRRVQRSLLLLAEVAHRRHTP
jgi:hypothetical protein